MLASRLAKDDGFDADPIRARNEAEYARNIIDRAGMPAICLRFLHEEGDALSFNLSLLSLIATDPVESRNTFMPTWNDEPVVLSVSLLRGADVPVTASGISICEHLHLMAVRSILSNHCASGASGRSSKMDPPTQPPPRQPRALHPGAAEPVSAGAEGQVGEPNVALRRGGGGVGLGVAPAVGGGGEGLGEGVRAGLRQGGEEGGDDGLALGLQVGGGPGGGGLEDPAVGLLRTAPAWRSRAPPSRAGRPPQAPRPAGGCPARPGAPRTPP